MLPLAGRYTESEADGSEYHQSWTVLWPFFSGERGTERRRLHCPWPIVQIERDATARKLREKVYVWPLYGTCKTADRRKRFALWPFLQQWKSGTPQSGSKTSCLMPFYWASDRVENGTTVDRYRRVWPLARLEAGPTGSELRLLSLWPGRRTLPIERNYAPFWTLYRLRRTDTTTEHEALWGLWQLRRQAGGRRTFSLFPFVDVARDAESSDVSIFKGLAGWGRTGRTQHRRFLWFLRWSN